MVLYLLEMSAIEDKTAETDARILRFNKSLNKIPIERLKLPWSKVLRFDLVENDYILNGSLIEGLQDSILQRMHSIWSLNVNATVKDLVQQAKSLPNLRNGSRLEEAPCNT